VGRDGRTPCRTHRFLLRGDKVVLNLNHPEVRELVELAEIAPALAGHWGLALVLTDGSRKFLPHLSPAAREDLILADALAKAVTPAVAPEPETPILPDADAFFRGVEMLAGAGSPPPATVPGWSLNRRPGSA
jgi:hypothetical protein